MNGPVEQMEQGTEPEKAAEMPVLDGNAEEAKNDVVKEPPTKLEVVSDDTKFSIRKKVWGHLEKHNLVNFPRPVTNRIPNFKGAKTAGDRVAELEEFQKAQSVKVNPDKPQEQVRFRTLEGMKSLYVPTPRLRAGLFNKVTPPPNYDKNVLKRCATSIGTRDFSIPIGLDDKIKVDVVVVGSVAVSTTGLRVGKGEGFADLEFGMMVSMGAITDDTVVITTVLDEQIMDLPEEMFEVHDLPIDIIVTPTQVIHCNRRTRPIGIIWSLITIDKMKQCPILKKLRERERAAGIDVTLKDNAEPTEEDLLTPDEEERRPRPYSRFRRGRGRGGAGIGRDGQPGQVGESAGSAGDEDGSGDPKLARQRRRPQQPRRRRTRNSQNGPVNGDGTEGEGKELAPTTDEEGGSPRGNRARQRRLPRRRGQRPSKPGQAVDGVEGDAEGPSRPLPRRQRRPPRRNTADSQDNAEDAEGNSPRRMRRRPQGGPSVFVGSIPREVRVSSFKAEVRGKDVNPIRVVWRGGRGFAILQFTSGEEMEDAIKSLEGLSIMGKDLKVEKSTSARKQDRASKDQDEKPEDIHDLMASGDAPVTSQE